ncbi:MAG: HAD family hydrolase [Ignavibacteriae bacterium]|nr:HAD family hydrolase [Ignavibacteriota bacterium]
MIKGITFDLWDTVFIDDSDEPKRKNAGRPTKAAERRLLVHQFVNKHQNISQEKVNAAYDAQDAAFRKVWHDHHITWKVKERLEIVLKGINVTLPPNEMNELVKLHEEMELEYRPNFIDGVHDAIKELSKNYKLGVISDAIFSPGRALRKLLEDEGLLKYFSTFVFSDEVGCSKPAEGVFHAAKKGLELEFNEIVHIGDREHNDILGPEKMGMHSILCLAALDRGSDRNRADGYFEHYNELPNLIEKLKDI